MQGSNGDRDTENRLMDTEMAVFRVVMYRCKSWTIKKPEH